jgi:hypothetical protein
MRSLCGLFLLLLLLAMVACPKKQTSHFKGADRQMVYGALAIRLAINAYRADTAELPPDIRAAERYLPPGTPWPVNPYNSQPIEDNRSAEFDPARSVGTVYYEVYFRDEQASGYRLHVFGDKGRLMIFDNSAFGAQ